MEPCDLFGQTLLGGGLPCSPALGEACPRGKPQQVPATLFPGGGGQLCWGQCRRSLLLTVHLHFSHPPAFPHSPEQWPVLQGERPMAT